MSRTRRLSPAFIRHKSGGLNCKGFTLVELLVALVVTGVVLGAVATLAFAISRANDTTNDTAYKQTQVRYATLRVSQLVRNCKLICFAGADDFALWRADDNNDGKINIGELVYIERGTGRNHLQLTEFPSSNSAVINLGSIQGRATSWWTAYCSSATFTQLIPQCSNVQFSFDVLPPRSKFVNVSFEITEGGIAHQYQISAKLRGWAGNLLREGGGSISLVSDDD
jgi:prepilin-type N-terminal cleavage/methylation domain-containing protein